MLCLSGIWIVKEGREEEFARRWQESVDSTVLDFPGVTFRLMRDRENPHRFISLGEGWRNIEQVEAARSSPSFQEALASLWRLLESGETSTLDLVAEVS
jgi:quinol monooxygenase YgiN